ncbi:MAG TPA: cytochrome c, partial [Woeseiaceae bacterium]|nr:cytochrome c [Woeseiaceae bacterium]
LARGRERYGIYCAPCHGGIGDGDGMIVHRGFPRPPSFHAGRLRQASARYFVRIITDGKGDMYSYAARVAPADRWAIAAYVKALQLSQHVPATQMPEDLREGLAAEVRP